MEGNGSDIVTCHLFLIGRAKCKKRNVFFKRLCRVLACYIWYLSRAIIECRWCWCWPTSFFRKNISDFFKCCWVFRDQVQSKQMRHVIKTMNTCVRLPLKLLPFVFYWLIWSCVPLELSKLLLAIKVFFFMTEFISFSLQL